MTSFNGLEVPVGTVMPCVDLNFTNLGNAWLVCNGQLISTSTYPDLYNVIGSTYNTGGESSGYFRVPNCVDVIPKCETSSIGSTGGSNTYSLTTSQLPSHYHVFNQFDHYHYFSNIYGDDFNGGGGNGDFYRKSVVGGYDNASAIFDPVTSDTYGVGLTSGSGGGGGNSFNAVPASKKVLYIIKT